MSIMRSKSGYGAHVVRPIAILAAIFDLAAPNRRGGAAYLLTPRPRLNPRPQHLRHTPGLGNAAGGGKRFVTFEYLRDAAEASVSQVLLERRQGGPGIRQRLRP